MNAKERGKIMAAKNDAKRKMASGTGTMSKDYYKGMVDILEWVLLEV